MNYEEKAQEEQNEQVYPLAEQNYTEEQSAEEQEEDYSHHSKTELFALIKPFIGKNLSQEEIEEAALLLQKIKPFFEEMAAHEREEAHERFLAEGGEEDGFEWKQDALTAEFFEFAQQIRKVRQVQKKKVEEERRQNLERKQALIEKLRTLIELPENEHTIKEVKQIQKEWKSVGAVPTGNAKTLWSSYNALMDIFYNNHSIYNDLKDLDRKRNLESKIELCEKAEALAQNENLQEVVKTLNELHEEFKHIGPVPKDAQDNIWERFKKASDAVYEQKRKRIETLKASMQENLAAKQAVYEELLPYKDIHLEKIKEWNEKTKEMLDIQKRWEAVGPVPRDKAKELNKQFWAVFKAFFRNKNEFFKKLDESREENLQKKVAICEAAEQIMAENETQIQWEANAEKLKKLQEAWKNIGAVPEKQKEEIYLRFKKTLDAFFEARRQKFASQDAVYKQNLEQKNAICERLNAYSSEDLASIDVPSLLEKVSEEWKQIGFVPKKHKDKITERFQKTLTALLQKTALSEEAQENLLISTEMKLSPNPVNAEKKLYKKEENIRKRIKSLEDELATLNNNLGFFANSKQANQFRASFEEKIERATQEIQNLKAQLKAIRKML
jgi:hypothetical protein